MLNPVILGSSKCSACGACGACGFLGEVLLLVAAAALTWLS